MLNNMQIDDRGADRSHFQDNVKDILKAEKACRLADEEREAARQGQAGPAGDRIRTRACHRKSISLKQPW